MRIRAIPDRETALRLLELQHMHIDVLERHVDWLERGKACGEREGREWTTSALREFDALWADK